MMKINLKQKTYINEHIGYKAILGYFAQQANGSVWLEKNGTVVLAAVTREKVSEFPGYMPLTVDYRELYSATGKIPGGYFKREGKPSDKEVLIGRIIDRCLRPLFPDNFFDKINIIITVYSIDKRTLPTELALIASSLALEISDIPFNDPAGCIEIAKLKEEWHFSPTHEVIMNAKTKIVIGGDCNGINMADGFSDGVSSEDLIAVFFEGHEKIKAQIKWQEEIAADYNPNKNNVVEDVFNISHWLNQAKEFLSLSKISGLFTDNKAVRNEQRESIWKEFLVQNAAFINDQKINESIVLYAFNAVLKETLMHSIAKDKRRVDGRDFDTVRNIDCLTGVLPHCHGSGVFTRGVTQLLVTTTLGGADDALRLDSVLPEPVLPFMLHYNFLPFSVGEAKSLKHPGRREIGHGFLAFNAIKAVLPSSDVFPYSIRLIGDVLSCDGSSSMATICGGILSLLDAGVPLKEMVAGIAMGMIIDENYNFHYLTDIAGIEDELGLMDFKVAGTKNFITAVQMDIKHKIGLSKLVLSDILKKSEIAKNNILKIMQNTINQPKVMSSSVPRFHTLKIMKEKIGAVIGSGGKVIKEITEKSGAQITIEDDGLVKIFGTPGESFDKAIFWIKMIAGQISVGDECEGILKRIADFGYFVEIAPNCDGLVHVSSLSRADQNNFRNLYKEGTKIKVSVIEYDTVTNRIRLKIK